MAGRIGEKKLSFLQTNGVATDEGLGDFAIGTIKNTTKSGLRDFHG